MTDTRTDAGRPVAGAGPGRVRVPPVVTAAVALIAVQLVWKHDLLNRAYFINDDYIYLYRAVTQHLGWDYLMYNYDGQIMPVGFAIAWVLAHTAPLSWAAASGVTLAMQAAASLAVLYALRVLFGPRWVILIPLAVYLITPLTVPTLGWWAASLNNLPMQIALPMAIAAHVHYLRRGSYGYALQAAGWILLAQASYLKGGIIPLVLLALTSAYYVSGAWDRNLLATLRRHGRVWALYGGLMALQAAVYLMRWNSGTRTHLLSPKFGQSLSFTWRLVGETFVTYAVGGPWTWVTAGIDYGTPRPSAVQVVAGWLVLAALVALSVRYRRVAHRAWIILFAYVLLADVLPPLLGRMAVIGPIIGFETRYVADAAPLVAILGALAFLPLAGEREPYVRPLPSGEHVPAGGRVPSREHVPAGGRVPAGASRGGPLPVIAGVAAGAYIVSSLWSVHGYTKLLGDTRGAAYIANARSALRHVPPNAVIYPRRMPGYVMNPLFAARAMSPDLLAPLAPPGQRAALLSRAPTEVPLVFDDTGTLKPAKVVGSHSGAPAPGHACWETTFGAVQIPMTGHVPEGTWTVQLSYITATPTSVVADLGDGHAVAPVTRKLGRVFFPITGSGDQIKITAPPSAHVCIGDVTIGYTDAAM
ncbi:MAG TPA: hypothetical protein VGL93_03425 [Streptosporangiaceae bacterium]